MEDGRLARKWVDSSARGRGGRRTTTHTLSEGRHGCNVGDVWDGVVLVGWVELREAVADVGRVTGATGQRERRCVMFELVVEV